MIVVDTNLIGYLYLESEHSLLAERAWCKDGEWAAPLLWRSEFRNVLAFYIHRKWLTLEDSQQIMSEALNLMTEHEYEVDSSLVLQLVDRSSCSAYDCEFVALAQELRVPLLTMDQQILRDFPAVTIPLTAFV